MYKHSRVVVFSAEKCLVSRKCKSAKKGYDVRCNSVHPAFVDTPILDPLKQAFGEENAVAKLSRQIPMNKIGDTDDVSFAILYLASDESKFMTGTEIVLDGGLSAM